jgi:hypothetical protein
MAFVKGHTHSAETRLKISEAGKGRAAWNKGLKMPDELVEKNRQAQLGKKLSDEHKAKLSKAFSGDKSVTWKGDKVSYSGIHKWINKQLGKPTTCEECKTTNLTGHQIHWANISGKYLRESTDWIRLCATCHVKYDDIGNRAWVTRRSKNV